jgi:phosphate starvation-inducible PhoH-like protein
MTPDESTTDRTLRNPPPVPGDAPVAPPAAVEAGPALSPPAVEAGPTSQPAAGAAEAAGGGGARNGRSSGNGPARARTRPPELVRSRITLKGIEPARFFGVQDRNLRLLESSFPGLLLVGRDRELAIEGQGPEVNRVIDVVGGMLARLKSGEEIEEADLRILLEESERSLRPPENYQDATVLLTNAKRRIYARTIGQFQYLKAIEENDIVFSIGPAGTGKTYLAVAMAVKALRDHQVQRIVLARPAVEAGESLGFLPGDLREKVDPYLRPLYDALYDMIPTDRLHRFLDTHTIEVVPLAFMRGRTLNNAMVILDEAQNTTTAQMKMFLTRLGVNAKAIVTGDITQVDLPADVPSGLIQIQNILMGIEQIAFIYLTERDVVRHRLVREIIKAYEERGF